MKCLGWLICFHQDLAWHSMGSPRSDPFAWTRVGTFRCLWKTLETQKRTNFAKLKVEFAEFASICINLHHVVYPYSPWPQPVAFAWSAKLPAWHSEAASNKDAVTAKKSLPHKRSSHLYINASGQPAATLHVTEGSLMHTRGYVGDVKVPWASTFMKNASSFHFTLHLMNTRSPAHSSAAHASDMKITWVSDKVPHCPEFLLML